MPADPLRTPDVESLLEAFAGLASRDDVYAFLLDVCTTREIHDMAQRLAVARMLAAGVHYPEIQRSTGASPTTISRVSRCVNYGAGGYRTVIERLGTIDGRGGDR
ncbi:MAG: YerC/YecD family TrpR-related protein [Coriobacteriia bacterium]|nr:YerC/YecD family TrpR-related protein [Coriobacteriia bacterium]